MPSCEYASIWNLADTLITNIGKQIFADNDGQSSILYTLYNFFSSTIIHFVTVTVDR